MKFRIRIYMLKNGLLQIMIKMHLESTHFFFADEHGCIRGFT